MENDSEKECDFNHLLLYAKSWYKRSDDVVEDIRKIMAHRAGMETKFVSDGTLWGLMIHAFLKYVEPRDIERLMEDLFKGPGCGFDPVCPLSRAVESMLGKLSIVLVKKDDGTVLLNLGEPDPAVLPLDDKGASRCPWKKGA